MWTPLQRVSFQLKSMAEMQEHGLLTSDASYTTHAGGSPSLTENILGTSGNNIFRGDASNDTFWMGAGDDFVFAGGGRETFHGNSLPTLSIVNGGNDTVSYSFAASAVNVDLIRDLVGTAGARGGAAGDTFDRVENVIGSRFNDRIFGNDRANTLGGGEGADTLSGGRGADVLRGGGGNDALSINSYASRAALGDQSGDRLFGDAGNDTFTGWLMGRGDQVTGGPGADFFDFRIGQASLGFRLTITDYDPTVTEGGARFLDFNGSVAAHDAAVAAGRDYLHITIDAELGLTPDEITFAPANSNGDPAFILFTDDGVLLGEIVFAGAFRSASDTHMGWSVDL